jgi:beta-ketodecanoyl-[acyl-carrier-protein] synthase
MGGRVSECVISGTGLWVPPERISNAELVASLTAATERWNLEHKAEIEAGTCEAISRASASS